MLARQPLLTKTETKLQGAAEQSSQWHQWPCAEITVRKLGTSQIPTLLPHFDECAKQILRNPPPPRANRAFQYHKNPHIPPPWPGVGGVGISIDKCIMNKINNRIRQRIISQLQLRPRLKNIPADYIFANWYSTSSLEINLYKLG